MTLSAQRALGFTYSPGASSGLTFGLECGTIFLGGVAQPIGPQTVKLTASATNYVEVNVRGVASANTSGFTADRDFLFIITTGAAGITAIQDWRLNPATDQPFVAVTTITNSASPYTVLASDRVILADATSGAITINLLDPTVVANRRVLEVVLIGTNATNLVTLSTPSGVIGVGGASTWALQAPGSALRIVPDGTNYNVLGGL